MIPCKPHEFQFTMYRQIVCAKCGLCLTSGAPYVDVEIEKLTATILDFLENEPEKTRVTDRHQFLRTEIEKSFSEWYRKLRQDIDRLEA